MCKCNDFVYINSFDRNVGPSYFVCRKGKVYKELEVNECKRSKKVFIFKRKRRKSLLDVCMFVGNQRKDTRKINKQSEKIRCKELKQAVGSYNSMYRLCVQIRNVKNKRIRKSVHMLVARAFCDGRDSKYAVHLDGNLANNEASNLEPTNNIQLVMGKEASIVFWIQYENKEFRKQVKENANKAVERNQRLRDDLERERVLKAERGRKGQKQYKKKRKSGKMPTLEEMLLDDEFEEFKDAIESEILFLKKRRK